MLSEILRPMFTRMEAEEVAKKATAAEAFRRKPQRTKPERRSPIVMQSSEP